MENVNKQTREIKNKKQEVVKKIEEYEAEHEALWIPEDIIDQDKREALFPE